MVITMTIIISIIITTTTTTHHHHHHHHHHTYKPSLLLVEVRHFAHVQHATGTQLRQLPQLAPLELLGRPSDGGVRIGDWGLGVGG